MKIEIEGRHLKVTDAIQDHVHKKIDHLDRYFDGINNILVILSVQDNKHQAAEVVCAVVRGQPLVGKAVHADMYVAIDQAVHKIREQLKKHKARLRDRKRISARLNTPETAADGSSGSGEAPGDQE